MKVFTCRPWNVQGMPEGMQQGQEKKQVDQIICHRNQDL